MGDEFSESARLSNLKKIRAIQASATGSRRRHIMRPNEGWADLQHAMASAMAKGMSQGEFEWRRLVLNGWTYEDEVRYAESARACRYNLYKITTKHYGDVGINLITEAQRLMREGKFPGQPASREPGEDG